MIAFKKPSKKIVAAGLLAIVLAVFFVFYKYQIAPQNECRKNHSPREYELITLADKLKNEKDKQILRDWRVYYDDYLNRMSDSASFGGIKAYIIRENGENQLILDDNGTKVIIDENSSRDEDRKENEDYRHVFFSESGRTLYYEYSRMKNGDYTGHVYNITEKSPRAGSWSNYDITPGGKYIFTPFGNVFVSVRAAACVLDGDCSDSDKGFSIPKYDVCPSFSKTCAPPSFAYYDIAKKAVILVGRYETDPYKQNFTVWEFSPKTGEIIKGQ